MAFMPLYIVVKEGCNQANSMPKWRELFSVIPHHTFSLSLFLPLQTDPNQFSLAVCVISIQSHWGL
jgi:hypothetical protein